MLLPVLREGKSGIECGDVRLDGLFGHTSFDYGLPSVGSKAQDWLPLVPELVHGEEGNMTLAYGQIALVNTIILAKHETEQDKEIKKLKDKVAKQNEEILRLKARINMN